MHASLARLLHQVVDYAGLFPPARLDMHTAVDEYWAHRQGEESWIVNRFICPANRLAELENVLSRADTPDCVPIAVIGTGGRSIEELETGLEQDAIAMTRFEEAVGRRCEIEGFEVRIPAEAELDRIMAGLEGFSGVDVFVELPWQIDMRAALVELAASEWLEAKVRTGGLEAHAFPSASELAQFIRDCLSLDVAFKMTAGMHHPIRHFNGSLDVWEHGFLNVLCATAIAESHELAAAEIAEILEETDGSRFAFGETGFGWNDWGASVEDIESIRGLFVSFGSCSIVEPLEGLARLGFTDAVS